MNGPRKPSAVSLTQARVILTQASPVGLDWRIALAIDEGIFLGRKQVRSVAFSIAKNRFKALKANSAKELCDDIAIAIAQIPGEVTE